MAMFYTVLPMCVLMMILGSMANPLVTLDETPSLIKTFFPPNGGVSSENIAVPITAQNHDAPFKSEDGAVPVTSENAEVPLTSPRVAIPMTSSENIAVPITSQNLATPGTLEIISIPLTECQRELGDLTEFKDRVVTGIKEFAQTDAAKSSTILGFRAEEWLYLADKYQYDELRVVAESRIGETLDVGSALEVFRVSSLQQLSTLKAIAINYIRRNLKAISATTAIEEFAKANPQGVGELFSLLVDDSFSGNCRA